MAKKTKKRLVTGLACAVPAVIAVPSLLALTQCGSKESTEHIKLSGDTKKETTINVFDTEVKYELLLSNVKDPSSVQISLPVLKVNGKDIPDSQKFLMYKAHPEANGVVTIVFDVQKIKESVNTNDEAYEVKFNVNLQNAEFNETLADFKLNIITPSYEVVKSETGCTITSQAEAKYNEAYDVTVTASDYYDFKGIDAEGAYQIKIGAKSYTKDDTDVIKDWNVTSDNKKITFSINGEYIKDKVSLTFKADKIAYTLDKSGLSPSGECHIKNIDDFPTEIKYGESVHKYIQWDGTGYTFTGGKGKLCYVDGTELPHSYLDEYELFIDGRDITEPVYLSCSYTHQTAVVKRHTTTDVGLENMPTQVNIFQDYEGTYTLDKTMELYEASVYINGIKINYDSTGTNGYKMQRLNNTTGYIFIPGKLINAQVDIYLEQTTKYNTIKSLKGVDGKLVFAPGQEKQYEWDENPINLTLKKVVSSEESYIKRGYKLAGYEAYQTELNPLEPTKQVDITSYVTPTYISGYETKSEAIKAEAVNGFTISEEVLTKWYSTDITFAAKVERCERKVTTEFPNEPKMEPYIEHAKVEKISQANVENNFTCNITATPGHELKAITIRVTKLDGTSYDTLKPGETEGVTFENGKLTIDKSLVVGDLHIIVNTACINYSITSSYGQVGSIKGETLDRGQWTKGHPEDKAPIFDEQYEMQFKANDHFTYKNVEPKITMGNSALVLDQDYEYDYDETNETIDITIYAQVVTDDLNVTCVPEPIAYKVDKTAVGEGVEFKDFQENAYYNQKYVLDFNVKKGYSLNPDDCSITIGGTALTEGYDIKYNPEKECWEVVIDQYVVTGAVALIMPTTINAQNVYWTAENTSITDTTTASYVNGYYAKLTLTKGYVIEQDDANTISCNYAFTATQKSVTDHVHVYDFNIAKEVISPIISEENAVRAIAKPKLEHYGMDIDTTGFTGEGVTFTLAEEPKYLQGATINVTGIPLNKALNIEVLTGTTKLTGVDIKYTVSEGKKTATITIPSGQIVDKLAITGTIETIECGVNLIVDSAASDKVQFYLQDGTEVTNATKVEHSVVVNWKVSTPAGRYLSEIKVEVKTNGQAEYEDITSHVTFNRTQLVIPAAYVTGDLQVTAKTSATTLTYNGTTCTGFNAGCPDSERINEFGTNGLTFDASCTAIGANAFHSCNVKEITKLILNSTIADIGEDAFHGMANIKTIVFNPQTLTIHAGSFNGMTDVTVIDLHAVTNPNQYTIAEYAFAALSTTGTVYVKAGTEEAWKIKLQDQGRLPSNWTIVPEA